LGIGVMLDLFKNLPQKPSIVSALFHCPRASIKLRFALDGPEGGGFGFGKIDFARLNLITTKVQIEVFRAQCVEEKLCLAIPSNEAAALFGESFPSPESLHKVVCFVFEKKNYPIPEPGIPGGGGKSASAQGQTKKPDAHSHKKHR
jgi:hypothetical protein